MNFNLIDSLIVVWFDCYDIMPYTNRKLSILSWAYLIHLKIGEFPFDKYIYNISDKWSNFMEEFNDGNVR